MFNNIEYHNLEHVYNLVKIFENDSLKEIMPEVYKLFALILTIPSTSVSAERSFSYLNRIKNYLRNSTSQQRLSCLSTVSIKNYLLRNSKKTNNFMIIS